MIRIVSGYEIQIDPCDVHLLEEHHWYVNEPRPGYPYVSRNQWINGKKVRFYLHRVIMGNPSGKIVDHKDGNTLNYTRKNLRIATRAQNNHNRRKSNSSTGFKGVYRVIRNGRVTFQTSIHANGVRHWLGTFPTLAQALHVHEKAAKRLHKEFAAQTLEAAA